MKIFRVLFLLALLPIVSQVQSQFEPNKRVHGLEAALQNNVKASNSAYPVSLQNKIEDASVASLALGCIAWYAFFGVSVCTERDPIKASFFSLIPGLVAAGIPFVYTIYQYCKLIKLVQSIKNDIEFIGVATYEKPLKVLTQHETNVRNLVFSLQLPAQAFDLITSIYKIKRKLVADYVSTEYRLSAEKKQKKIQKLNIFLANLETVLFKEPHTSIRLQYEQPIQEVLADELVWYLENMALGFEKNENRIASLFGGLHSKKFAALHKAINDHDQDQVHKIFEKLCLELGLPIKPIKLQFLENV